jgi:hypothetical protein
MIDIFNFNNPRAFIDLARHISQAGKQVRVCVLEPLPDGLTIRYSNISLDQAGHPLWTWDPGAAERAARAPIVWGSWPEHDGPLTHPVDALTILSALRRKHA